MKIARAGFAGGVIGGLTKLLIDQIALAINISSMDTSGTVSQVLYGGKETSLYITWGIYALITGIVGWGISKIITKRQLSNFFSTGVITGISLWAIMNIIFYISGTITPTWSMGISTFIVNLLSHIVYGLVLIYIIARSQIKATDL